MLDLEPPKPTKEFHEAYMEIYGKTKKKEEKKESFATAMQKPLGATIPSFDELDMPPLKIEVPEAKEVKVKEQKTAKSPTLSPILSPTLDELDLPPLKLDIPELNIPELKTEQKPAKKPLFSLFKKEKKAVGMPALKPAASLAGLDEPPQKIPPFTLPLKSEKKKPLHDFLAEVKAGNKAKPLPREAVFDEHKEGIFEKSAVQEGARDVQFAFEKTHPFETAGHEFLEKIQPLEKPAISFEEPAEAPKIQRFKSPAECRQYMKAAKEHEQKLKKLSAEAKKNQQTVKVWMNKQQLQERKIAEKIKKIEQMEQELHQKQEDAKNYEQKLQELYTREDAILEKERELKQRQEDIHDTEQKLREEEGSILAKIKRLEADQRLLEKEQDAIAKTVAKMEREKAQIAAKTREFSQIMKNIADAEKELKEKAGFFAEREEAIRRKEKLVEKEVLRVEALKKKAAKLKDVEQTYERMKKRLREAYQEYEEKFLNKEVYAQKEARFEQTVELQAEKPVVSVETGDITNLVTATKQLIIDKKYEEANRNISKLMQRYMQIPENNPRKKEIYYDILSVKNMLKLDLLE